MYQFYDVSDNTMTKKYLPFFNQKIKLKMEDRKWKIQGFTLIELLIVISIIGILAAMVTISFMNTQRQARDTQRKSDLSQYRNALETFASKNNGLFPGENTAAQNAVVSADLITNFCATPCPLDPKNSVDATYDYKYQSDGTVTSGNPVATQYVLWAKLENATNTYWVVCSGGQSGKFASPTTPLPTGGNCLSPLTP